MLPAGSFRTQQIQDLISHFKNQEVSLDAVIYVDGNTPCHVLSLQFEESAFIAPEVIALKFKSQDKDTFFSYGERNFRSAVSLRLVVQRKIGDDLIPEQRIIALANAFLRVNAPHYHLATPDHSIRIKMTTITLRQLKLLEEDILKTGKGSLSQEVPRNLEGSSIHASHAAARKYANDPRIVDAILRQSINHATDVRIGAVREITWHLNVGGFCDLIETMLIPQMEETDLDDIGDVTEGASEDFGEGDINTCGSQPLRDQHEQAKP